MGKGRGELRFFVQPPTTSAGLCLFFERTLFRTSHSNDARMIEKDIYSDIVSIFSPGYVVRTDNHPIIDNVAHPLFQKILSYTDQAIFVLNHSTFEFLYVSENIQDLVGFPAETYKRRGVEFSYSRLHPEDVKILQTVVFPDYYRCMDSLPAENKIKMKSTYTCRFLNAHGNYIQCLQQNIPLTIENDKVILGLIVWMDITAFKKDHGVTYKNVLIEGSDKVTVLSEGKCGKSKVLTDGEIRILRLTADGLSEKQIADRLCLSIHTVKSHRKNMVRKAGVKNSAELVKYGIANLLI